MAEKINVFVYGTLKKGESNHRLLKDQEFLGTYKTTPEYRMYDYGFFPCLKEDAGHGISIEGELYKVDSLTLRRLDVLEGISTQMYKRDTINLEGFTEKVQAYFFLDSIRGMRECGERWARRSVHVS